MGLIKREYRIVVLWDYPYRYIVQTRLRLYVFKSFWRRRGSPSGTVADAHEYIDTVLCKKVYEQGTYPPRTPAEIKLGRK